MVQSKMAKRIVILTHAGGSPRHGPNMRWYFLGKALNLLDVEVEIVSSSYFHKYIEPPKISKSYEWQDVDGIKYHWISTPVYKARGLGQILNQLSFVVGCWRYLGLLVKRAPDIVIASSPHPLTVFPARALAARTGARFIYEVRDLWPQLLIELAGVSRKHPYIQLLKLAERYGVSHADFIISVKPGDFEYFSCKYNSSLDEFLYVPNGASDDMVNDAAPEEIEALRKKYSFLVGYVGAISAYYGLEELIKLAHLLRSRQDIGFVVIGSGDRQEALKAEAKRLGISSFHLAGPVKKKEVHATLQLFDACYVGLDDLPLHKYGISCNKIYDYMQAGRPIIGSYTAGYDPVKASGCGIVAPRGELESLKSAILELAENPELGQKMGLNGRKYFEQHHNHSMIAQRLKQSLFPDDLSNFRDLDCGGG